MFFVILYVGGWVYGRVLRCVYGLWQCFRTSIGATNTHTHTCATHYQRKQSCTLYIIPQIIQPHTNKPKTHINNNHHTSCSKCFTLPACGSTSSPIASIIRTAIFTSRMPSSTHSSACSTAAQHPITMDRGVVGDRGDVGIDVEDDGCMGMDGCVGMDDVDDGVLVSCWSVWREAVRWAWRVARACMRCTAWSVCCASLRVWCCTCVSISTSTCTPSPPPQHPHPHPHPTHTVQPLLLVVSPPSSPPPTQLSLPPLALALPPTQPVLLLLLPFGVAAVVW